MNRSGGIAPEGARAAALLLAQKARVIELWEARVREALPAVENVARPLLIDSLPLFLDTLARALDGTDRGSEDFASISVHHAEHRASLSCFSLSRLFYEYRILRRVLFECLDAESPLGVPERALIVDFIEFAQMQAGVTYAQIHEDDMRRALGDLAFERNRFAAVTETIPHLVWVTRAAGEVEYLNSRWAEYTGGSSDQPDWDWQAVVHPNDLSRVLPLWNECLRTGQVYQSEVRMRDSAGTYRWHMNRGVPVRNAAGKIVNWFGTCTDIDDLKRVQRESIETLRALEQERDLRERFVQTLTHDLRTPLAAARISAQMADRRSDDLDAMSLLLGRVVSNIDRADNMIRDLLDANRIGAGQPLPLQLKECDLQEILRETIDSLTTVHGERFVLFNGDATDVYWDAHAVRRMLENLCNNAVKYGDDAPIVISVTQTGLDIDLDVHNQGAALTETEQVEIFLPYHRTSSAGSQGSKGWGLGLTLVRGLAEAHGGSVTVRSSATEGTSFRIRLPRDARVPRPTDSQAQALDASNH